MSEIVDRVADAVQDVVLAHVQPMPGTKSPYSDWDEWFNAIARAAIRAMREPSTAMIREGESAAPFGIGKPSDDEAIPRVWRAMINAALQ